jgi:hypothetical protein
LTIKIDNQNGSIVRKEQSVTRKALQLLLVVMIVLGLQLSALPAGRVQAAAGEVTGKFTRNGLVLTITSRAAYELLWGLQINYCDGTSEQLGKHSRRGIFGPNISESFTFYAEKPMQRVVITSLPVGRTAAAPNFSTTQVRRSCGTSDTLPKLACKGVQVASEFHRSWEGEPISFTSNSRVYFAGLKLPGVDGLAPVKEASFKSRLYYAPSLRLDFKNRVWSGTFISMRIPVGTYKHGMLVVEDTYGQQAKCPVGEITVLP